MNLKIFNVTAKIEKGGQDYGKWTDCLKCSERCEYSTE